MLALILVGSVVLVANLLSIVAVRRFARRARRSPAPPPQLPPVTVLKPLCGADDALEANLESFFKLAYPRFELVFGVEGDADPAIPIVRGLRARYPEVSARLVIHDGRRALNPKVSNLQAMLEWGAYDLVAISDSNVAVAPDWLARSVADLHAEPGVGLLANLFVGGGEQTLGATLEALHLAGPIAGPIAATQELGGQAIAVGKSVLFRRSVFEGLGGFTSVGAVLAEDYVMMRMFAAGGYKVRLGTAVVTNVVTHIGLRQFLARHVRWSLIRSRVNPLLYPLEPLMNPMTFTVLAPFVDAHGGALALLGPLLTIARDALQWWALRREDGLLAALPLGPFKDLMMLGVWAVAPFVTRVGWRGRTFHVGAGTRLYADQAMAEPERLEWE